MIGDIIFNIIIAQNNYTNRNERPFKIYDTYITNYFLLLNSENLTNYHNCSKLYFGKK